MEREYYSVKRMFYEAKAPEFISQPLTYQLLCSIGYHLDSVDPTFSFSSVTYSMDYFKSVSLLNKTQFIIQSLRNTFAHPGTLSDMDPLAEQMLTIAANFVSCCESSNETLSEEEPADQEIFAGCPRSLCNQERIALTAASNLLFMLYDTKLYVNEFRELVRKLFYNIYNWLHGDIVNRTQFYYVTEESYPALWLEFKKILKEISTSINHLTRSLSYGLLRQANPKLIEALRKRANITFTSSWPSFAYIHNASKYYNHLLKELLIANKSSSEYHVLSDEFMELGDKMETEALSHFRMSSLSSYYFRQNVMSVRLFLSDMRVKVEKQRLTYDFWTMLSDIGGTISFYIGGSLITVFEIIFWCSDLHKKKKLADFSTKNLEKVIGLSNRRIDTEFSIAKGLQDNLYKKDLKEFGKVFELPRTRAKQTQAEEKSE